MSARLYVGNLSYTTMDQQLKDAFYTDTVPWKEQVLAQSREALSQAADGLAR